MQKIPQRFSTVDLLILIIGILGGYIYYSQILKPDLVFVPPEPDRSTLDQFKNLNLNFAVLEKRIFSDLRIFGESPVTPTQGGKTDLFAPF